MSARISLAGALSEMFCIGLGSAVNRRPGSKTAAVDDFDSRCKSADKFSDLAGSVTSAAWAPTATTSLRHGIFGQIKFLALHLFKIILLAIAKDTHHFFT